MSVELTVEVTEEKVTQAETQETDQEWTPTPPPTDLIFDDGEPLESNRHRIAMNVLIEAVHQAYGEREDYFVGGNMFVYYSSQQVKNKDFKGPDFFVALNVDGTRERQGWVAWEEEGRYPDMIVELMSPSTAAQDVGKKKTLYEQTFRTRDYVVYDPFSPDSLQGWHLGGTNLTYQPMVPDDRGWLWCETLGLWLGLWEGSILKERATWLRFFSREGNLILLGTELAQQERERADEAQSRADEAQSRADEAQSRAEQAQREAQQEREKAAQAERKIQELQEQLKAMGIDPEQLS